MGILDDAIKEHLELKRQHGADDDELKQLEDEAFGESERPGAAPEGGDSLGEAPTEFMSQPDFRPSPEGEAPPPVDDAPDFWDEPGPRSSRPEAFDLQEPPRPPAPSVEAPEAEQPPTVEAAPPPDALPDSPTELAEEGSPAMEHEAFRPPDTSDAEPAIEPEPPPPAEPEAPQPPADEPQPPSHSTAEREAIAEQPTELFDVEGDLGPAATEPPAPPEPAPPSEAPPEPEDAGPDDFFDEKRLSDELDQALDAPVEEDELEPEDSEEDEYDEEEDEEEDEEDEPSPEASEREEDEEDEQSSAHDSERGEDLLEETPDFLEEAPEDDRLWFEQKPPKDFDFDD